MEKFPLLNEFQYPRAAVFALLPFLAISCDDEDHKVIPIAIASSQQIPISTTCVETINPINGQQIDLDCNPGFYEVYVGTTICNQIPTDIGVYPCNANNELGIYAFAPYIGDNLEVSVGFIGGQNILNIEGEPYTNIIYNQGDFVYLDDATVKIGPNKLFFPAP